MSSSPRPTPSSPPARVRAPPKSSIALMPLIWKDTKSEGLPCLQPMGRTPLPPPRRTGDRSPEPLSLHFQSARAAVYPTCRVAAAAVRAAIPPRRVQHMAPAGRPPCSNNNIHCNLTSAPRAHDAQSKQASWPPTSPRARSGSASRPSTWRTTRTTAASTASSSSPPRVRSSGVASRRVASWAMLLQAMACACVEWL